MSDQRDSHTGLHSEQGALAGEHPGRAAEPIIKVHDLAWLEFEKPDLHKAQRFAEAFGFTTALQTADELHLRGSDAGAPCVLVRKGSRSRFVGPAFRAADAADVQRLADATGGNAAKLPQLLGGLAVDLVDPSGLRVRVVVGHPRARWPARAAAPAEQRRSRGAADERDPAAAARAGHDSAAGARGASRATNYLKSLNWYLEHLGLIVSDFLYYPGQRERGPVMSFIRCDRGATPTDHHTLAMALGPEPIRALGLPGGRSRCARRGRRVPARARLPTAPGASAGTSRAARSSTTGATRTGSWSSTTATATCSTTPSSRAGRRSRPPAWRSGGRRPPRTSSASSPARKPCASSGPMLDALREDNEFDLARLRGLLKAAKS